MKYAIIFIYLLTISSFCFSQKQIEQFVGLKPVKMYDDKEYIRISTPGRFINIHKDSSNVFSGEIIYVVQWTYKSKTDTLYKSFIISPEKSHEVYKTFNNFQIDSLKDDNFYYKNIQFLDGYPVQIERKNNSLYYSKEYNAPNVSDTINERVLIASLIDSLNILLDIESKRKDFELDWPLLGSFNSFTVMSTAKPIGGMDISYRFVSYSPFGISFSKYFYATKRQYIQTLISSYYNTDFKENYDYGIGISKIFRFKLNTLKKVNLSIKYRNRNYESKFNSVENLTLNSWYKHLTFGIDFKKQADINTGALMGFYYIIPFFELLLFILQYLLIILTILLV